MKRAKPLAPIGRRGRLVFLGFALARSWDGFLADGELLVVETADDHYVGTVEISQDQLVVRSGYVGRPVVLRPE